MNIYIKKLLVAKIKTNSTFETTKNINIIKNFYIILIFFNNFK